VQGQPHVAVIGSGPCGAIAANQLVARGVRVTLLESGQHRARGLVVRAGGKTVFRYVSPRQMREGGHVPSLDPSTQWYRSLSHGGLTNYWTGAVPRFAPEDFTDGARLDERFLWPITYDELVPYYEIAETALQVTAAPRSIDVLPANTIRYEAALRRDWAEAAATLAPQGFSIVPLPMSKGSPWMVALRGAEFNSFTTLVRPLRRQASFRLLSGAHVQRLSWSAQTSRVVGVDYVERDSGTSRTLAVDAVVVAAGTLSSTRILLLSRSGDFPNGLGNTDGVLGRYLHDHTRGWWTFSTRKPMSLLHHPAYMARAAYAQSEPLLAASCTVGIASNGDRLRALVGGSGTTFAMTMFGTMVPDESHTASLSSGALEEFDQPAMELAIEYDGRAVRNAWQARERFEDAFRRIGNPVCTWSDPAALHPPGASVHYAGTIRMHEQRSFGVLDAWNRIHDAPNVVVCDMSAFTTSPEKNPTLTAMAIAARASERLARDLVG
jgi:choline dehydrogenase-like flavoprotein